MDEPYRANISGENYDTGEIKSPSFFIDHTDVDRYMRENLCIAEDNVCAAEEIVGENDRKLMKKHGMQESTWDVSILILVIIDKLYN